MRLYEYLSRARDCEAQAGLATSEEARLALFSLAAQWRRLAAMIGVVRDAELATFMRSRPRPVGVTVKQSEPTSLAEEQNKRDGSQERSSF